MSNPIRQAIDNCLSSMRVTDRDVQSIMGRIRQEEKSPRRIKLRYAAVLVAVLALLTVSGTAAMLLSPRDLVTEQVIPLAQGLEDNMVLNGDQVRELLALAEENGIELSEATLARIEETLNTYGSYWTDQLIEDIVGAAFDGEAYYDWPDEVRQWYNDVVMTLRVSRSEDVKGRAPAEGELTEAEAIGMAKAYILAVEPSAPLSDPTRYELIASFNDGVSIGDHPGFYWNVLFRAKDRYVTEYDIDISATGDVFYRCDIQRGVGEGHTAQEIYEGMLREYHWNIAQWTQEQLRDYADELRKAAPGSLYTRDRMFLATEYPDIAEDAIPRDQAAVIAFNELGLKASGDCRIEAIMYIGDLPNPSWKVSIYEYNKIDGYGDRWLHYVEIDSVTGEVKYTETERYDSRYHHMYFLHTAYSDLLPIAPEYVRPVPAIEEAQLNAASYIQQHFGEVRNVNDTALFRFSYETLAQWTGTTLQLYYKSLDRGKPGYWVWLDGYGGVMDAGVDDKTTLDGIRGAQLTKTTYHGTVIEELQDDVRAMMDPSSDPLAKLLLETTYIHPEFEDSESIHGVVADYLGLRKDFSATGNHVGGWLIDAEPNPIWKLDVDSTKGKFLMEIDNVTHEVLEVIRVEDRFRPWYAQYLLSDGLRSIGMEVEACEPPSYGPEVVEERVTRGMDITAIFDRFRELYGPDPTDWSQAQLRSFKAAISESSSLYTELGVPCILSTEYPDIPDGAISRQIAATSGAAALGLADYVVEGGVLLGGDPNPVWKMTYSVGGDYYAAEIDCRTGEVKATGAYRFDDDNMNSYWFEGIVPEQIIDVERPQFTYEGNG